MGQQEIRAGRDGVGEEQADQGIIEGVKAIVHRNETSKPILFVLLRKQWKGD